MKEKQKQKQSIATLADLLMQTFQLDPGSLELLIDDSYEAAGIWGPTKVILEALSKRKAASDVNLLAFLARVVNGGATRRKLERSLKKGGLCPVSGRGKLRELLDRHDSSLKSEVVTKPTKSPSATPIHDILDLKDLSGGLGEIPKVIDRLGRVNKAAQTVDIELNSFTYAATLAIIAEWLLANGLTNAYNFCNLEDDMQRYLGRMQFDDALRQSKILIKPDEEDWAIGLTRINKDLSTEQVSSKIVDIISTFVATDKNDESALSVLISEMIENVHRHAKTPVDGYAVAQLYPEKLKLAITLVDAGIGVRGSFEEGTPSVEIDKLNDDADFLIESTNLYSTSKNQKNSGHTGYGLYILSELVAKNRGTFLLTSGTATIIGYQKRDKVTFDRYTHSKWNGTIISIILDLNNSLPINEVYAGMPLMPGYEP